MFIVLSLRTVAHPNFIQMHRCAAQVIFELKLFPVSSRISLG